MPSAAAAATTAIPPTTNGVLLAFSPTAVGVSDSTALSALAGVSLLASLLEGSAFTMVLSP